MNLRCTICKKIIFAFDHFFGKVKSTGGKKLIGDLYYNLVASTQEAHVTYQELSASQNATYVYDDLVIPDEVVSDNVKYSVTSIEAYAFQNCMELKSVVIGNHVTRIGKWAFDDCDNIKSVVFPDSLTEIGPFAFAGCVRLESVVIPRSVTEIGRYAFAGCINMTSFVILDAATEIGNWSLVECHSLKTLTIPNSVTRIGEHAFSGNKFTLHVSWPTPLEINTNVFSRGILERLYVPKGTKKLYAKADGWNQAKHIQERQIVPVLNDIETVEK